MFPRMNPVSYTHLDKMDRESIVSLGKDINEQADWLIQLVENILNMTKIDSGKLDVYKRQSFFLDFEFTHIGNAAPTASPDWPPAV